MLREWVCLLRHCPPTGSSSRRILRLKRGICVGCECFLLRLPLLLLLLLSSCYFFPLSLFLFSLQRKFWSLVDSFSLYAQSLLGFSSFIFYSFLNWGHNNNSSAAPPPVNSLIGILTSCVYGCVCGFSKWQILRRHHIITQFDWWLGSVGEASAYTGSVAQNSELWIERVCVCVL